MFIGMETRLVVLRYLLPGLLFFGPIPDPYPLARHSPSCSPAPRPFPTRNEADQEPGEKKQAEDPTVASEIVACVREAWKIVLARIPSKLWSFIALNLVELASPLQH